MLSPMNLTGESIGEQHVRRLSDKQLEQFSAMLEQAHERLQEIADDPEVDEADDASEESIEAPPSAKELLSEMSTDELELLQQAAGLAHRINVDAISEEGATNLLVGTEQDGMVDLNNDGLVEVGEAKLMTFPPVNAPQHVHDAWEEAIADLPDDGSKMMLQLQMHSHVYGIHNIGDLPAKAALPPEQQWSTAGWQELSRVARAALEFSVSQEGWTEHNRMTQEVFDHFDAALTAHDRLRAS